MDVAQWASIGGALGVWPALQWLWRRLSQNPKENAEARKLNAEADGFLLDRLQAEIERLDRELGKMREQLEDERRQCDGKIEKMQGRIRQLEQQQTSFGHISGNVAEGPLKSVYAADHSDKDSDLIGKLDAVSSRKPRRRR